MKKIIPTNKLMAVSLSLALFILVAEALIHDLLLPHRHASVMDELLTSDFHEILLRLSILSFAILFPLLFKRAERKQQAVAERLLLAGQEWERTFDAIPDLIAIMDTGQKIIRVNAALAKRLGREPKDLVGALCYTVIHGTTCPPDECPHVRLMGDNQEHSAELFERRLGAFFSVTASPLRDQDGRVIGCTHVMRDVTERRRVDEALRESNAALERQLRFTGTLLHAAPMAVFFKDVDGRYLGCNDQFSKIVGVPSGDITGKTVFELWPPDLAEIYHAQDQELINNPRHQVYEASVRNAQGENIDVIFNKRVFTDENGKVGGIIGTFFDISQRKRAEEKSRSLNEELEQRVADRTTMLEAVNTALKREISERARAEELLRNYTNRLRTLSARLMEARESERRHIAHELHDEIGQLLTGVKLSLDSIRRRADEPMAAGLSDVQEELNRLMERVRDLSLNLRPSLLDTLGLLPTLQWHFKRYTEQTGIAVDFSHDGESRRMPIEIETVLYRVVQEALTNVARHAAVDTVGVGMAMNDREATVTIADRGAGFDVNDALEKGRTMGLSGMRERVDDLGGTLTIQSAPSSGTRLTIVLPVLSPLSGERKPGANQVRAKSKGGTTA